MELLTQIYQFINKDLLHILEYSEIDPQTVYVIGEGAKSLVMPIKNKFINAGIVFIDNFQQVEVINLYSNKLCIVNLALGFTMTAEELILAITEFINCGSLVLITALQHATLLLLQQEAAKNQTILPIFFNAGNLESLLRNKNKIKFQTLFRRFYLSGMPFTMEYSTFAIGESLEDLQLIFDKDNIEKELVFDERKKIEKKQAEIKEKSETEKEIKDESELEDKEQYEAKDESEFVDERESEEKEKFEGEKESEEREESEPEDEKESEEKEKFETEKESENKEELEDQEKFESGDEKEFEEKEKFESEKESENKEESEDQEEPEVEEEIEDLEEPEEEDESKDKEESESKEKAEDQEASADVKGAEDQEKTENEDKSEDTKEIDTNAHEFGHYEAKIKSKTFFLDKALYQSLLNQPEKTLAASHQQLNQIKQEVTVCQKKLTESYQASSNFSRDLNFQAHLNQHDQLKKQYKIQHQHHQNLIDALKSSLTNTEQDKYHALIQQHQQHLHEHKDTLQQADEFLPKLTMD